MACRAGDPATRSSASESRRRVDAGSWASPSSAWDTTDRHGSSAESCSIASPPAASVRSPRWLARRSGLLHERGLPHPGFGRQPEQGAAAGSDRVEQLDHHGALRCPPEGLERDLPRGLDLRAPAEGAEDLHRHGAPLDAHETERFEGDPRPRGPARLGVGEHLAAGAVHPARREVQDRPEHGEVPAPVVAVHGCEGPTARDARPAHDARRAERREDRQPRPRGARRVVLVRLRGDAPGATNVSPLSSSTSW